MFNKKADLKLLCQRYNLKANHNYKSRSSAARALEAVMSKIQFESESQHVARAAGDYMP